jgi:hypothetical protein
MPSKRHPISIRPTDQQMLWLRAEADSRGLAINALVVMAIERARRASLAATARETAKARREAE